MKKLNIEKMLSIDHGRLNRSTKISRVPNAELAVESKQSRISSQHKQVPSSEADNTFLDETSQFQPDPLEQAHNTT